MNIDYPQIDWITFTSWKSEDFLNWRDWQKNQPGEVKDGKIQMYSGLWVGSAFIGQGLQNNKNHYIARVSGEFSNEVYKDLWSSGVKATRIDVQITRKIPENYSARKFVDSLRSGNWGNCERDLQLIENSDGLDTVYLGSRKSERFARMYVKRSLEGDFLRFEIEYKGDWANAISSAYCKDQNVLSNVLFDFINTLPKDEEGVLQGYLDLISDIRSGITIPRRVVSDEDTYTWLIEQVGPVIWRYLNDHDRGAILASYLIKMIYESGAGKTE